MQPTISVLSRAKESLYDFKSSFHFISLETNKAFLPTDTVPTLNILCLYSCSNVGESKTETFLGERGGCLEGRGGAEKGRCGGLKSWGQVEEVTKQLERIIIK